MINSSPPLSLTSLPPYATTSRSRLQALYADISRQKLSNPVSYRSSIEWWHGTLETLLRTGFLDKHDRLVLNAGVNLMEKVKVEGVGKPLALGAVINELQSEKLLVPRSEFLTVTQSIYDPGWLPGRIAAFVVGKPLWWALEQLGVVGEDGILGTPRRGDTKDVSWWGEYVMIKLVAKAAQDIVEQQNNNSEGASGNLYTFEQFSKEFGFILDQDSELSHGDAKVLLRFLERDIRVIVVDKEFIKFVGHDASSDERQITAVDRGILELKTAVANMHAQVDGLQRKIDQFTQQASDALRQKRKAVALNCIRTRKQFEDVLTKRLGSLQTLESTLLSIEAAAGDLEIMKTYASSTTTLRTILADPLLQRESIDRTMDALSEANLDAKEVDEAVRVGGELAVGMELDEADLEQQLEALIEEMKSDQSTEKDRIRLEDLNVPQGTPAHIPVERMGTSEVPVPAQLH